MSLYTGALDHELRPPPRGTELARFEQPYFPPLALAELWSLISDVELNLLGERIVLHGSCAFSRSVDCEYLSDFV